MNIIISTYKSKGKKEENVNAFAYSTTMGINLKI